MTKPSKKFLQHKAAIESGAIGETFIRGFRAALHADARRSYGVSVSGVAPKISPQEVEELLTLIHTNPPKIEAVQAEKGLTWLKDKWKTPRGVERKNNPFGRREEYVLENFSHFSLVDFYDAGRNGWAFYLPVYRVHAKDGASFDYYAGSWQSGGNGPEII